MGAGGDVRLQEVLPEGENKLLGLSKKTLSAAQSHYTAILNNNDFISPHDCLKLPLPLPIYNANPYLVGNNSSIKEIEIHYNTGKRKTFKINRVLRMVCGNHMIDRESFF
jgi:hypothetical protein